MESFMDRDNMIKMGAGVVVVGGIVYFVNSKITALEERIQKLESVLQSYEQAINHQGSVIQKLMEENKAPPPAIRQTPTVVAQPEIVQRPRKKNTKRVVKPEPTVTDDDPEEMLQAEIAAIKQGRGEDLIDLEFEE